MSYNFKTEEKRGSTRHKLEEATYFFEQMKISLEDDKVFSFNLSAFSTAARSVTMLMNAEFKHEHVTEFNEWYNSELQKISQSDSNQSDLFEFFNKMRKATVHINRVKPNKKVSITIFESIQITESVDRLINRHDKTTDEEEHSSPQEDIKKVDTTRTAEEKNIPTSRIVERFFKEYPQKNLIEDCKKYLEYLTILVDKCERRFNNP